MADWSFCDIQLTVTGNADFFALDIAEFARRGFYHDVGWPPAFSVRLRTVSFSIRSSRAE
jgi:hypothetical protein